jgi:hypothetical protein
MPSGPDHPVPTSLEDFVDAFEAAWARHGDADPAQFVPDRRHDLYLPVLGELIRIDMELRWKRGVPRRPEDYRDRFPLLFENREMLRGLAFEEYRLRRQAGETPSPAEYQKRFGFAIGISPRPDRKGERGVSTP